jgi:hypothetical protein
MESVSSSRPPAFKSASAALKRANTTRSAAASGCGGGTQAAQLESGQAGHGGGKLRQRNRRYAALAGLRHERYLDANVERRGVKGPLLRQPPRHTEAIHALHPVEAFGNGSSLVGLDAADEVPIELQVGELVHFDLRLL